MPLNVLNPIELPLNRAELETVIEKSKDFALLHGLCYRSPKITDNRNLIHFIPFMLFPTAFPESQFKKAIRLQKLFNEIMCKIANNPDFLLQSLLKIVHQDAFTKRLFDVYEIAKTHHQRFPGPEFELFLLRSDYLLDQSLSIKQVEINTIASSLVSLSTCIGKLNKYTLHEINRTDLFEKLPENNGLEGFSKAFEMAWTLYGNNEAIILFVVESLTGNIADQRLLEYEILKRNKLIRVVRKTLREIHNCAVLSPQNELLIDDNTVAIVYYRAGYNPEEYQNENEWNARLLIEKSRAIKSPSLKTQLAGMKKVQQSLSMHLARFLKTPNEIEDVRSVLAELYELNDDIISKAVRNPERFVLKSQREGGGNNLFDDNLKMELEKVRNSDAKNVWILMERINSPTQKNYMIRPNGDSIPELNSHISELGVYGTVIYNEFTKTIVLNETVGHLLRTKLATQNETGINSGYGALDNVLLV